MKNLAFAAMALMMLNAPAKADHWLQTADAQTLQGINELLIVHGSACQNGVPAACQSVQYIQQLSGQMLNADYQCKVNSNSQACEFASFAYGQLSQAYVGTQQALARGSVQQPNSNVLGSTHAERMQNIHNWGQQRLEYGRRSQQLLDQRHQQFMNTLNN